MAQTSQPIWADTSKIAPGRSTTAAASFSRPAYPGGRAA